MSEVIDHSDEYADALIGQFAEILRDLIRALAAKDSSGALSSASRMMREFVDGLTLAPASLNWYKIFDGATGKLEPLPPYDEFDHEFVRLAQRALRYFAEVTTDDGFSVARTNKARDGVEQEISRLAQARQKKRLQGFD